MEIKKDILWRVYLCFIGIAVLGLLVIGRVVYIQQVQGKYWVGMGDSLHLKYQPIEAERGTIYSEDGSMLSTSVPIFDIYVDFMADGLREKAGARFKDNVDSLSIAMADLFQDKTAAEYKKILQQAYREKLRYFLLKRKISFDQFKKFREFPLVRLGRNKSGMIFDIRDKRINPYVLLANRTIGLSREDSTKNVGLELTYDSLLRGMTGQRLMRYSAGAYLPVEGAELDPVNGKNIVCTIDPYIQDVTEGALMKMLVDNNSTHGTAIVMETATGKIKAIANLGKQIDGTYTEDLNYGIGKRTEPGSIFKLATLISLLEDKYVDTSSIVDVEGGAKYFYGLRIKDSHLGAHNMTVKDAFLRSSNVAFAKLADQYYHNQPEKFTDHLHALKLDTLTGVDIVASSGKPVFYKPKSKYWHATSIPYMAHGYGQLVTPINMLTLYNAVANKGKMMRPYLVSAVEDYGVTVEKIEPQVLVEKICSDETLAQVKSCLKAVVDSVHGTAHKVCFDTLYSISGKTGTAVSALNNKGYNKGNKIYQASFMGYFPSEDPKFTIGVVIQNSNESRLVYGADVSGRVFKEISDRLYNRFLSKNRFANNLMQDTVMYDYYGRANEMTSIFRYLDMTSIDSASDGYWRNLQVSGRTAIMKAPVPPANGSIPNVIGMGLKDAIYMLENLGLVASVSGRGKVINQSLAAGTPYKKGQHIMLVLN